MSAENIEINRRDFLKIVFGTVAATLAPRGTGVFLVAEDIPVFEPYRLELEGEYLFDPLHDLGQVVLPTWREKLEGNDNFSYLTVDQQDCVIREALGVDDFAEYPSFDREEWLGTQIDIEDLSMREVAMIGPYWPGVEIFEQLGWEQADTLGVQLVEGDHPGSSFMAAQFIGDVETLNIKIAEFGMNLAVV